ncbi:MAG: hypothetical protein DMG07_09595 [Acidobacteria bacterium]|nr:MAG: hypothetical protein DMG07_09595 [Acidobacteriota bacterium]
MRRRRFLQVGGSASAAAVFALRQPARGAEAPICYMPGDTIDPSIFVLDVMRQPLRLMEIARPDAKAVVLVIFGGPYLTSADKHGGIWCEDSLDEFANLKAAVNRFKDQGVQFISVACPPVYSERYGWEKDVFLDEPETSPKYIAAAEQFIARTQALQRDHTIPFETVAYDLRFRLLWNPRQHAAAPAYGAVYAWQGKFKWHKDDQRYGTPCVWFLNARGKVLREPLYGNNYSAAPPRILFTYWELEGAVGEALGK